MIESADPFVEVVVTVVLGIVTVGALLTVIIMCCGQEPQDEKREIDRKKCVPGSIIIRQ